MTPPLQIRELRKERGLTLAVVASEVGISIPHMSDIERGKKNLNAHLITKISAALKVSPGALFKSDNPDELSDVVDILDHLDKADLERVKAFALALSFSAKD